MSDKAYIFAAMIWIFMLLPPAVMMAYYSYLLNPEAATLSKSHKVAIAHDGSITITFPPSEDEDVITPHPITMRNEDLDDLQDKNNMIILTFRKSNLKFLIIPVDSFPTGTLPLAIAALTQQ